MTDINAAEAGSTIPPPELGAIQRVRVGQHRIRVSINGEGPPLLLINGIGANIEMWQPLIEAMPNRQKSLGASRNYCA